MAADAEATLPALIEACKRLLTDDRKRAFEERAKKACGGSALGTRARSHRGELRLGCQPYQHGADGDGDLGAGEG